MKRPNSLNSPGTSLQGVFEPSSRSNRFLGLAATILILASLVINLGFGRWGSHIGTPIPGLYFSDFLLFAGALLSLTQFHKARLLPKTTLIFALPLIYFLIQAVSSVIRVPSSGYTLWVRDMAPFAYLSLVPLIALSLALLKPQVLVLIVRWSALIYAIGYASSDLGLIPSWANVFIYSESVPTFSYRGDFTGFAIGIGIVAWGRWNFDLNRNSLMQGALLVIGLLASSRSALVTLLILTIVSVLKDWSSSKFRGIFKLLFATLITSILLSFTSMLVTHSESPPESPPTLITSFLKTPPAIDKSLSEAGGATASARIATSIHVLHYLSTNSNWVLGSGPGTDALYFACTGIQVAPKRTILESSSQMTYLPKCAVDSYEASSTLRDPHNWVLNLLLYHGVIGLLVITLVLVLPLWTLRSMTNYRLSAFGVIGLLTVSSFGVILSAPFGLVPLTAFLAYLYANAIRRESLLDTT